MTVRRVPELSLKRLGIDTYKESVIYMREDCEVCLSEGLEAQARVKVQLGERNIIATVNIIKYELLGTGQVSLSEYAWKKLRASEGDKITISHAQTVRSLSYVRSKIYGNSLSEMEINAIIQDITDGRYSDIHISAFLTGCAGGRLDKQEVINLTKSMVNTGEKLTWDSDIVVDKHCVGGLPGNRTSPIVVSIVSAFGLTMPKTSSRAITSPSGTADTMEVLAPVEMDLDTIRRVVKQEQGCLVWGGGRLNLSPADEMLIRVEKPLDLDSEGQLISSVMSKKISAGSTHMVIDIPVGETAKVRTQNMANTLKDLFESVAKDLGVHVKVIFSCGDQPVGRGIGPALEARDVVAVLQGENKTLKDLRDRSLTLASNIIEFSPKVPKGEGMRIATDILDTGKAWKKFQAICEAQGGMRKIPIAPYTYLHSASRSGAVTSIDNRRISLVAKLSGSPADKEAGVDLHVSIGSKVEVGEALFTIHANSPGELDYALGYLNDEEDIIMIEGV